MAFIDANARGISTLWILVSFDIRNFNVLSSHLQHIAVPFSIAGVSCSGSFIYGSTISANRLELWSSLANLDFNGPWFSIGELMRYPEPRLWLMQRFCSRCFLFKLDGI